MKKYGFLIILCFMLLACNRIEKEIIIESEEAIVCMDMSLNHIVYVTTNDYEHFNLNIKDDHNEIKTVEIKHEQLKYVWDVKCDENNISIIDEEANCIFNYDYDLNLIKVLENQNFDNEFKHQFVDSPYYQDEYLVESVSSGFNETQVAFSGDEDKLYIFDDEVKTIENYYEDYVVVTNDDDHRNIAIYDYINQVKIFEYLLESENDVYLQGIDLNEQFILIHYIETNDYQDIHKLVRIHYPSLLIDEQIKVKQLCESDLKKLNQQLMDDIKKQYDITIYIDHRYVEGNYEKATLATYEDDDSIYGTNDFDVYELLVDFEAFLDELTPTMVYEMTNDFYDPSLEKQGIHVIIVKDFKSDIAAYVTYPYEDQSILLVINTDDYASTHLPHEFMHIMENKIDDYLYSQQRDSYEEWMELNPKDHQYGESYDYDHPYFINNYMNTTFYEDRAVLFEYLYMNDEEDPYWMSDEIKLKADYLIKIIDEAFVSVDGNEKWNSY